MTATVEAERRITCPGCGDVRWLSTRNARGIERGEMSGLCHHCRYPNLREVTENEAEAFARWWLDRYSDEEIAELAESFGVADASAASVAASRARLEGQALDSAERNGGRERVSA